MIRAHDEAKASFQQALTLMRAGDAKIGIEDIDGDWEISLFVDNLTDEQAEPVRSAAGSRHGQPPARVRHPLHEALGRGRLRLN